MTRARRLCLALCVLLAPLAARAQTDAVLDDYIRQALSQNATLRARHHAVDAAWADAQAARARRLPELSLNARYSRADGGRTIDFPAGDLLNGVYTTLNQFLLERGQPPQFPQIENQSITLLRNREQETKLSITAPLFAPALWADAAAHDALWQGSLAGRQAYQNVLTREIKRAYYGAAQARALVEILQTSERLLAENVRVSQALVDAGKATRDRVLRAEAEKLSITQKLDAARTQAQQARRMLNYLRNADLDAAVTLPDADTLPLPSVDATVHTRPELTQMEAGIDARRAAKRAADAARLPTVALVADYGVEGTDYHFDRHHDFASASLVLRWTLFDAGNRRAAQRKAQAEIEQLHAERDDLEQRLALARHSARDELATAVRAVSVAEAQLAASESGFHIAERKRAAASLSQIEFLDAERLLTEARANLAIARCSALDRAAELELANATLTDKTPLETRP
ncbi:TolC family protein [Sinimarinibacterium sp. NLF-5-8]|uniref:TolC family protein n=1 Tax=Sinimarinibacterium sp. NLF-5-8 TaxID=2698684 RepID=UPI00137BB0F0|nr:TolC family protein [Sinimarinibacterium sp. NLF-5-8]QHS09681.1 TolC family protein [Sinimarinibacterium sp. NLF-5-8]